ncbi:FeoA family protein [Merdibacter massiliensis]|uniref:FeoA family protein n=1 Tax=Merdibacter massiliensis TaxID=1871030 RepID=UPI00096A92F7|nr:FeoA family protein [Merdibacter massiliensis]
MYADQLKNEQTARVLLLKHSKEKKERLTVMGICKNAIIRYHGTTLFRDPLLFEVDETLLAIRRKDARLIEVELL